MGFLIKFPIALEKSAKPIEWRKAWETCSHTFSRKWVLFFIRFPSCGILHHMGNAWVFSSIPHSMGNVSKTHRMGKSWEIGSHTFPIVWVLFSIRFSSYGILHHMGNAWVFSSIFHSFIKVSKTLRQRQ